MDETDRIMMGFSKHEETGKPLILEGCSMARNRHEMGFITSLVNFLVDHYNISIIANVTFVEPYVIRTDKPMVECNVTSEKPGSIVLSGETS